MDIYEFNKLIGSGMYGQVYLAYHKLEGKHYAIKRINFKDINPKDRENIENEVLFLQELKHPNIVSYKDSFCDRENYFNIVMIYCEGGDIYTKIKNAPKGKYFPENEIIEWIVQLGLAMSYVHDKKILHRDIKTQNIFLKEGKVRIGDFGIAKMFNNTKDLANSMVGTPLYMSPEQYNNKKYGFKSDIWALGCCLFEMCNLKHAFEGSTWNGVALKVLSGHHAPVNDIYSKDLKTLIDQMLSVNPKTRPSINRILRKPFIKKKVAQYIYDFMQNYKTDPNLQADEIQMEILKDQAEKLGIFNQLMKEIHLDENNDNKMKSPKDNLALYLKKKEEEKNKIEEKIKDLENQKKKIIKAISVKVEKKHSVEENKRDSSIEKKKNLIQNKNNSDDKSKTNNKKNNKKNTIEDEYAKLKVNTNIKNRSELQKQVSMNLEIKRPDSQIRDRKASDNTENKDSNKKNFLSDDPISNKSESENKPKFLENKKAKKPSFGNIDKELNIDNKIKKIFNTSNQNTKVNVPSINIPQQTDEIITQHYSNNAIERIKKKSPSNSVNFNSIEKINKREDSLEENVLNTIKEENLDDSVIESEKKKLLLVTNELNKMKEILEKTNTKILKMEKIYIEKDFKDNLLTEEGNISDNLSENDDNIDMLANNNNLDNDDEEKDDGSKKLLERIKFLRHRCESALGNKLYIKAYEYLKANKNNEPQLIREHLINLFGKNNIGFWLLIDQILYLEELLNNN